MPNFPYHMITFFGINCSLLSLVDSLSNSGPFPKNKELNEINLWATDEHEQKTNLVIAW